MAARKHVTHIKAADSVAKQDSDQEAKAKAEAKGVGDPKDAVTKIKANSSDVDGLGVVPAGVDSEQIAKQGEVQRQADLEAYRIAGKELPAHLDPKNAPKQDDVSNTILDNEEKRVALGGPSDEELAKKAVEKSKEEADESPLTSLEFAHPASSKEAGGKEVSSGPAKEDQAKKSTDKKKG